MPLEDRPRNPKYGQLIRKYRRRARYGQIEAGRAMGGLSDKTVRRIEREGRVPPPKQRGLLEEFLKIPPHVSEAILKDEKNWVVELHQPNHTYSDASTSNVTLVAPGDELPDDKARHASTKGSWERLASRALRTEALQLVLVPSLNGAARTRALGPTTWKKRVAVPHFAQSDRVRLEVNFDVPDTNMGDRLPAYCVCFVIDDEQVTCLCPNSDVAPNARIDTRFFRIPAFGMEQPLEFFGATGRHAIYILLSQAEIPQRVREPLQLRPQPLGFLDEVSEHLWSIPDLTILKTEFIVD